MSHLTLIPDMPYFPLLPPPAPQSHAVPAPKRRKVRLAERRNLYTETGDLSEEEEEVDDVLHRIKERGLEFYIPLGKTATAQEERADANLDSASSSEGSMSPANNSDNEGENGADAGDDDGAEAEDDGDDNDEDEDEDEEDLDDGMEDLDEDDMDAPFDDTGEFDGSNFIVDPRELPSPV